MVVNNFSPEKYVNRLNKQMEKYTNRKYLLKHVKVEDNLFDPTKDICNYNDLLMSNPLKRDTDKKFMIKEKKEV